MPYIFTPPTQSYGPAGGHRLFAYYKLDHGLTVVNMKGVYQLYESPSQDLLEEADEYWMGGRNHTVTDDVAQRLTDAGFEDYLTEII